MRVRISKNPTTTVNITFHHGGRNSHRLFTGPRTRQSQSRLTLNLNRKFAVDPNQPGCFTSSGISFSRSKSSIIFKGGESPENAGPFHCNTADITRSGNDF
jgi:hypothetical protein